MGGGAEGGEKQGLRDGSCSALGSGLLSGAAANGAGANEHAGTKEEAQKLS